MSNVECSWKEVGKGPCPKPVTHTARGLTVEHPLCTYHAGKARREGWPNVRKADR